MKRISSSLLFLLLTFATNAFAQPDADTIRFGVSGHLDYGPWSVAERDLGTGGMLGAQIHLQLPLHENFALEPVFGFGRGLAPEVGPNIERGDFHMIELGARLIPKLPIPLENLTLEPYFAVPITMHYMVANNITSPDGPGLSTGGLVGLSFLFAERSNIFVEGGYVYRQLFQEEADDIHIHQFRFALGVAATF